MTDSHAKLFEPFTLNNGVTLQSRLVIAPLTLYCQNPDGTVSEAERDFISSRGRNFGMVIHGATLVSDNGQGFPGQPRAIRDYDLQALKERVRLTHANGSLAIAQIHHAGILGNPAFLRDHVPVGPSENEERGARALMPPEVKAIIRAFAHAAELCLVAGYDGVEIHGANRYLIQQFYSGATNHRTDEWGGSNEARMRFPLAVLDAVLRVKERSGKKNFIIGYRLSPEEPEEAGITMKETLALIQELIKRDIQYIHVSEKEFFQNARRGADETRSRLDLIHEAIAGKTALIGLGNLFTGDDFDKAIGTGWVELAATGRAVMLNPDLATLIREGRDSEIQTKLDPVKEAAYHCPKVLWPRLPQ